MSIKLERLKKTPKILGLDISTKTTGFAILDFNGKLLELTHFSPKIKPLPEDKVEVLLKKAELFKEHIENYKDMGIVSIVIEEPLLQSNNIYTVGTLLRYNSFIVKICYDVLGIIPKFISTYNARKYAFPDLMSKNVKGVNTLFGGYEKTVDKKHIIWEHVNAVCDDVKWLYNKKGGLMKENYDMADAVTCVIGYINMIKQQEQEIKK